jgi:hypothetical protein
MEGAKEIYVSVEIARKLWRVKFNGDWHKHYWGYKYGQEFLSTSLYNPEYDYPAPTHQTVLAWLRRDKHIMISIQLDKVTDNSFRYCAVITNLDTLEVMNKEKIGAPTYESATEKAIMFVFDYLISQENEDSQQD